MATVTEFEEEQMYFGVVRGVLDHIWCASDGATISRVFAHMENIPRRMVMDAIDYLKWRGLLVEVTRTHGWARSEMDHKRLMCLKSNSIGGVR